MNKKNLTVVLALIALAILPGCATNYAQDVVKNGASNYIVRYSAKDPEYQPVVEAESLGGISLFSVIQLAAAGYAGSVDGLSGAATSLAIDEAVANRRLKPGQYNMLFAWLPESYGSSPEDVEAKYASSVTETVVSVIQGAGMSIDLESPVIPAGGYGRRLYRVSGNGCGEVDAPQCLVELTFAGKHIRKPVLGNAPDMLDGGAGGQVWSLTTRGGSQVSHRSVSFLAPPSLGVDVERIYEEISRRLPGQSFMYLVKSPTFNVPVGEPGKVKGYYYALHNGKELSFARK